MLTIGLVALLLAISKGQLWGWAAPSTLALRTAEVVILIAFVFVELPKEAFKPRRSR